MVEGKYCDFLSSRSAWSVYVANRFRRYLSFSFILSSCTVLREYNPPPRRRFFWYNYHTITAVKIDDNEQGLLSPFLYLVSPFYSKRI